MGSLSALKNIGSIPKEIKALGSRSKIFVKMVRERESKVTLCHVKCLHSSLTALDGDRLYSNIS